TSAKYNVIDRRTPAITYRIEKVTVTPEIKTTRIVWGDVIDVTADEALAAATPAKDKQGSAVTFLQDMLTNGPVPVEIIQKRADVRGFSWDQMKRARSKMGVVSYKGGLDEGWMWALPQHAPASAMGNIE